MLEKEINELREKLNKAILREEDYGIIYNISIQLDELIDNLQKRWYAEYDAIQEQKERENKRYGHFYGRDRPAADRLFPGPDHL